MRNVCLPVLLVLAFLCFVVSARGDTREPPTALPPRYAEAAERARDTGRPLVIWAGVRGRVIAGAVGLECGTFPEVHGVGIVVGVWRGERFARYDLPATADDAAILAAAGRVGESGAKQAGVRCRNCGAGCPCGAGCACDAVAGQSPPTVYAAPPPPVYALPPVYRPAPVFGAGFQLGPVGGGVCIGGA